MFWVAWGLLDLNVHVLQNYIITKEIKNHNKTSYMPNFQIKEEPLKLTCTLASL